MMVAAIVNQADVEFLRVNAKANLTFDAYPGLELLPDGTFVTTTYGCWTQGELQYVVSVRFTLQELDAKIDK